MKYWVRLEKLKKIRFSGTKIGCSGNFYKILGIAINYILCEKTRFLNKKSVKTDDEISSKRQKPVFRVDFRHFQPEKNFFSKIGLSHILGIANTHLCAKNQEKLMMKSRENAKKPVFPGYFRHFRPEKNVFRKSGSVTF